MYIKRNLEMIDKSDFCVVYFTEYYQPKNRNSGTKVAYDYAVKKHKTVIKLPNI